MKNKTFIELYNDAKNQPPTATPAMQFINEVARFTHRSESAVRNWIAGRQVPEKLVVDAIAKHFDVSPENLFPEIQE